MSPRNWMERIQDILDAIAEIQSFMKDVRFEKFQNDMKTVRAVELDLIIIGEEQSHFLKKSRKRIQKLPGI